MERKSFIPVWDDSKDRPPETFIAPSLEPPKKPLESIEELARHARLPFHNGRVG